MSDLDPDRIATLDDLAACLRQLRLLADSPSYRDLEGRTVRRDGILPGTDLKRVPLKRDALTQVLAGAKFPRKAFLLTFVEALGVDLRAEHRWEQAWNRLAVQYQEQADAAAAEQFRRQLAAAEQRADDARAKADRAEAELIE